MKPFLCFLLLSLPLFHARGEDDAWSKPDGGLRGRLVVLPVEKPGSPFCRVFIELQNTEDVMGQRKIRFKPEKLDVQVVDMDGKTLARANEPYDGMTPLWEPILLPYAGTIKFQVSFPGLGYHPDKDKAIVDMGSSRSWIIPPTGDYFLTATFSVAKEPGDHPIIDWSGSITFPPAKIPGARSCPATRSSERPSATLRTVDEPGFVSRSRMQPCVYLQFPEWNDSLTKPCCGDAAVKLNP